MNWRIAFIVVAVYAVGTNSLILGGILPAVADGLDISESTAGLGLTVFSLTYAMVGPFLPIALGRLERRMIMAGALVVFIGGSLMSAFPVGVEMFMVSRAIVAVGAAAIPPQAAAVAIAMSSPERAGRALGILSGGMLLSIMTGVPLGAIIGNWVGYSGAFVLLAAFAVLGLVGLVFVPTTVTSEPMNLASQFTPFREPTVMVIGVAAMLFAWCQFSVTTFLAPILLDSAGLLTPDVAVVLVVYGFAGLIAAILSGPLIDRYGGYAVAIAGFIVIVITTPLFSVTPSLPIVLVLVIVWSTAQNAVFPAQQSEAGRLHPENPATTFAIYAALIQVGGAVGVALSGIVLDSLGPAWIAPLAALAALTALALVGSLAYRVNSRGAGPKPADGQAEVHSHRTT